jgi:hypothetical protein
MKADAQTRYKLKAEWSDCSLWKSTKWRSLCCLCEWLEWNVALYRWRDCRASWIFSGASFQSIHAILLEILMKVFKFNETFIWSLCYERETIWLMIRAWEAHEEWLCFGFSAVFASFLEWRLKNVKLFRIIMWKYRQMFISLRRWFCLWECDGFLLEQVSKLDQDLLCPSVGFGLLQYKGKVYFSVSNMVF